MRHRKQGRKLNRTSSHRDAMFRNMVTSLFKHERIKTTDAKAKELRVWADNMVTLAKKGDLHARRQALAIIREKAVVHKLFDETVKRFADVSGGYTRVIKLGFRAGDAARMSLVELVDPAEKKGQPKKAKPVVAPAPTKDEPVEEAAVEASEVASDETPVETAAEEATTAVEEPATDEDVAIEVEAEAVEAETAPESADQEVPGAQNDAENAPKDGE